MITKLSNRQLFKKYKEILAEYKSEIMFENFCSRTLSILLLLEKEIARRGYNIISNSKEKLVIIK